MTEESEITVLIVDDEPDNLQNIVDAFRVSDADYRIMKASNGQDALEIVEKRLPDIVITDWDMPVMDGVEFVRRMRRIESTNDIPVIMCTGVMTSSENLKTALEAGASDYIRKPVDRIELIARTRSMLALGASFRKIREQNAELRRSHEEIERIARIDPLTQMANRRAFWESLNQEAAVANRSGRPFVIALGDVDDFKEVNDQHGHDAGDFVLVSISNVINQTIRAQDIVARWGGEEFIFLFPDTSLDGGRIIAEKICTEIEGRTFKRDGLAVDVSMTIGACAYGDGIDIDTCLKHADDALYAGKRAGKSQVVVWRR